MPSDPDIEQLVALNGAFERIIIRFEEDAKRERKRGGCLTKCELFDVRMRLLERAQTLNHFHRLILEEQIAPEEISSETDKLKEEITELLEREDRLSRKLFDEVRLRRKAEPGGDNDAVEEASPPESERWEGAHKAPSENVKRPSHDIVLRYGLFGIVFTYVAVSLISSFTGALDSMGDWVVVLGVLVGVAFAYLMSQDR